MFKKDFKNIKNQTPLRASDRRKLKDAIMSRFLLSDEDGELLVPSGLLSGKFINHLDVAGITYYDQKGVPLWFQAGSSPTDYAALVPTVYTLWKRIFLPVVITPQLVIEKMRTGADLMAPGVVNIIPSHAIQLPVPANTLVCVIAYSRDTDHPPMAVGRMDMSSSEIENADKGKAVLTLHTYGDALWEKGGKLEPPKELSWIRPEPAEPSTSQQVESTESIPAEVPDEDGNSAVQDEQDNPPPAEPASQAEGGSIEPPSTTEVDQVLRNALFFFLNSKGPALDFPFSASALYADCILPFRPSSIDQPSYVIKHSSFKKLKPFLKSIEKDGILKLKEMGGELYVMALDMTHPDIHGVKKYRTVADDGKKEEKAKAAAESENSGSRTMVITEYYKPHGASQVLFKAVGASTSEYYTAPSLRDDILSKYITQNSLVHPIERGYFTLDDLLKSVLLGKKDQDEFLKRDVGLQKLMDACQPWYEIQHEGRREMRKGKLTSISVVIKTRQGKRAVTLVTNYELFFFNSEAFAEDLRKLCAAQTSVSPVPGRANQLEVLVQGKQGKAVMDYFMEKGVPKRWIEVDDTTEKKKPK